MDRRWRAAATTAWFWIFLICLLTATPNSQASGISLTVGWTASADPRVAGYVIYTGSDGVSFPNRVDLGNISAHPTSFNQIYTTNLGVVTTNIQYVIPNVPDSSTLYFYVCAYFQDVQGDANSPKIEAPPALITNFVVNFDNKTGSVSV